MKNSKIIYYIMGFMPLAVSLFFYPSLPDSIPSRYNFTGDVLNLDSKEKIFIIPILLILFICAHPRIFAESFLSEFDENSSEDNISKISKLLFIISVNLLSYLEIFTALKEVDDYSQFNFYNLLSCILCLVFIFMGYIFLNCSRNSSVSLKIPALFMDNLAWDNIHKTLGSYWISSSVVCLPIGIFCKSIFTLYLLILEICVIVLIPLLITKIYIKRYINKKN